MNYSEYEQLYQSLKHDFDAFNKETQEYIKAVRFISVTNESNERAPQLMQQAETVLKDIGDELKVFKEDLKQWKSHHQTLVTSLNQFKTIANFPPEVLGQFDEQVLNLSSLQSYLELQTLLNTINPQAWGSELVLKARADLQECINKLHELQKKQTDSNQKLIRAKQVTLPELKEFCEEQNQAMKERIDEAHNHIHDLATEDNTLNGLLFDLADSLRHENDSEALAKLESLQALINSIGNDSFETQKTLTRNSLMGYTTTQLQTIKPLINEAHRRLSRRANGDALPPEEIAFNSLCCCSLICCVAFVLTTIAATIILPSVWPVSDSVAWGIFAAPIATFVFTVGSCCSCCTICCNWPDDRSNRLSHQSETVQISDDAGKLKWWNGEGQLESRAKFRFNNDVFRFFEKPKVLTGQHQKISQFFEQAQMLHLDRLQRENIAELRTLHEERESAATHGMPMGKQ